MNLQFKVLGVAFKIQSLIGSNITVLIDVKELIVLLRREGDIQPVGFGAKLVFDGRADKSISRLVFQNMKLGFLVRYGNIKTHGVIHWLKNQTLRTIGSTPEMNLQFKVLGITFKIQRLIGSNVTVLIDVKELIVLLRKERDIQPVGFGSKLVFDGRADKSISRVILRYFEFLYIFELN